MPKKETELKEFFWQLKAQNEWGGWNFPPLYTDRVFAKNKAKAKEMIEDEFGRKLPLRVLHDKKDKEPYLLRITELTEDNLKEKSLFEVKECKFCEGKFRVIDHYNDSNSSYNGKEFCSDECYHEDRTKNRAFVSNNLNKDSIQPTVIYQITNSETNLSYIGKTSQCFTLRWYQHFFQSGSSKFHVAIRNSRYTDWTFNIIEVLEESPKGMTNSDYALKRESYWINKLDTINNGYNSIISRVSLDGSQEENMESTND